MDENREILELEIEDEYKERILAGEKPEPGQFLKKFSLAEAQEQRLLRRLKKWEESMSGFEEYYESIDKDSAFRNIQKEVNRRKRDKERLEAESPAGTIIVRVIKQILEAGKEALWIEQVSPQMRAIKYLGTATLSKTKDDIETVTEQKAEQPVKFVGSGESLEGMTIQHTPKDRIVLDSRGKIKKAEQIRFVDSEGNEVHPRITRSFDDYGRTSYDFSQLPPGEYDVIIELPEE